MEWGVFTFSKEGRVRLAGVLRALLIAQLVISLCMVIFCFNVSMKVMQLLKQIHKVNVFLLYGLILFQAYAMKLHYTGGLRLITLLLHSPYWPRVAAATRVWMVTGALLPLNGFLVYAACRATLKALMKELSSSLRVGISQYLTEPTWKRIIDTMQIELSCCGADKPNDWHEIPWISMDFLNQDSQVVLKLAGSDGRVLPPVSPYSCCTPRVLEPCYHDPLQQGIWGDAGGGGGGGGGEGGAGLGRLGALGGVAGVSWRHARGCVAAVRRPLHTAATGLRLLAALLLLLEVVILCLSRLLVTSAGDAALRGDCAGVGLGHLLARPAPPTYTHTEDVRTSAAGASSEEAVRTAYTFSVQRRRRHRKLMKRCSYPYLS